MTHWSAFAQSRTLDHPTCVLEINAAPVIEDRQKVHTLPGLGFALGAKMSSDKAARPPELPESPKNLLGSTLFHSSKTLTLRLVQEGSELAAMGGAFMRCFSI